MSVQWIELKPGQTIKQGDMLWSPQEEGDRWHLVERAAPNMVGMPYRVVDKYSVTVMRKVEVEDAR